MVTFSSFQWLQCTSLLLPSNGRIHDELQLIHDWLPPDDTVDAYVKVNNIPRVKDVNRFRELRLDPTPA